MGIIKDIEEANRLKTERPHLKVLDALGNHLEANDIVSFIPQGHVFGRVVSVQEGGIHTPQGITPSICRVIIDLQFPTQPGQPIPILVKVVSPAAQAILEKMTDHLPRQ